MELFGHDLTSHVVVVAEIGVNHEGDESKALELIKLAAGTGCDAVKLQSYTPHRLTSTSDPTRFERVSRFGLSWESHARLLEAAAGAGITVFSTPASEDWVPLLDGVCPALKIASADLDFEPVVTACAATDKPLILSTGMASEDKIETALGWVRRVRGDDLAGSVALLHCVSAYPAPDDELNLLSVPYLQQHFGLDVGYSHHGTSAPPCLAAVALGARILEVHFTDQRAGRSFRDHSLSFEPAELRRLVEEVRVVDSALGQPGKRIQPSEVEVAKTAGKGVVAATDLPAGTTLTTEHLMFARPATGFPAAQVEELVGRKLLRDLGFGNVIRPEDLSPSA